MGAFSLPMGLTGNLFNLWGLTENAGADEPPDPQAEPMTLPVTWAGDGAVEDAAERQARTRGAEQ